MQEESRVLARDRMGDGALQLHQKGTSCGDSRPTATGASVTELTHEGLLGCRMFLSCEMSAQGEAVMPFGPVLKGHERISYGLGVTPHSLASASQRDEKTVPASSPASSSPASSSPSRKLPSKPTLHLELLGSQQKISNARGCSQLARHLARASVCSMMCGSQPAGDQEIKLI